MAHARIPPCERPVTTDDKPLLQALIWQGRHPRALSEEEALAIYERNWDFAGLLATPTEAELAFIRQLGKRHRSWLATATL